MVVVVVVVVSVYLSNYLSNYLSIYPSIYLFVCLSVCLPASLKTLQFCELPQFLNLATSKTKQFCETASIFELDNIKNEAILRDFLQKWKAGCRARPVHASEVLPLPLKIDARSYEVLHLSRKIIFPKLKI